MGSEWNDKACQTCSSIQIDSVATTSTGEHRPLLDLRHPDESLDINVFLVGALLIFLLTGVGIGTYLLLNEVKWQTDCEYPVVERKDWHALHSNGSLEHLESPATAVLLTATDSRFCYPRNTCAQVVQELQKKHMISSPDINYNFLIGGDLKVYEGTGWYRTTLSDKNVFTIAFIGTFVRFPPLSEQVTELKHLLRRAISKRVLDKCYSILIHDDPQKDQRHIINVAADLQEFVDMSCGQ